MCETAGTGDAAVLDRLGKVEALLAGLLGVAGASNEGQSAQVGIMDRLTNVEKRLGNLEDAVEKLIKSSGRISHHQLLAAGEESESKEPGQDENKPAGEDEAATNHHEHDEFNCGCENPHETHEKLKAFARKELFKCLKFLSPKPSDLYNVQPGSVGSVVVKEFKIPEDIQQSWWELHCQIVQTSIARARNNVSNDIKMTVRSKYSILLACCYCNLSPHTLYFYCFRRVALGKSRD
jgi:hypothetical protein